MRVRHTATGELFLNGFLHPEDKCWYVTTAQGEYKKYLAGVCESVPDETWQDVTEAINTDGCYWYHPKYGQIGIQQQRPLDGYRLVKEQLWTVDAHDNQQQVWAFRVEKKT